MKVYRSPDYNFIFDPATGDFARWGGSPDDDPTMAPTPEHLDIEIDTRCHGACRLCYKANGASGKSMSLDTFKAIMASKPDTLTQIAFGVGDWPSEESRSIFKHSASLGIAPNVTIRPERGRTLPDADVLARSGIKAAAVSRYDDPKTTYFLSRCLMGAGIQQVTIHQILSTETLDACLETLADVANPENELKYLHAVTFLLVKPKGRAKGNANQPTIEAFKRILAVSRQLGVRVGFDSCSAPYVLEAGKSLGWTGFEESVEPCESGLFSLYIDVNGDAYPCSFAPGQPGWETGIPVVSNGIEAVWNHPRMMDWKDSLLANGRRCPLFNLDGKDRS